VGFVDDIHLTFALDRRKVHLFPDVSYLIDSPVTGGVELDDVHESAFVDGLADGASVTGVSILEVEAIYRLG
jgi:hypothetical protein